MAMAKLFCRVMKMKRLVNSISVQKLHTQSISSSTPNPISLLLQRDVCEDTATKTNLLSILKYPDIDIVVENIDLPYFKDYPSFEICGRTNGMVCLADRNNNIMVGNPATSKFRTLPTSTLTHIRHNALGFGYDPRSKDFKVVRVFVFPNLKHMTCSCKAEVYSLTTCRWTEIINPMIMDRVWATTFEMYHKGIYYWWNGGESTKDQKEFILTFDFTHEVFRNLPVPECCYYDHDESDHDEDNVYWDYDHDDSLSLMVWNGSTVLSHNPCRHGEEKKFDIWAMDYDETVDGGVSWSKVLTIGPVSGVVRTLMFVNSDELVMEAMDGNIISYNVITKEIKNLLKGTPMKGDFLDHCLLSTSDFQI